MELEAIQKLAERALQNSDFEKTKQYYEMVLLEKPDDWRAIFYVAYSEASVCSLNTLEEVAHRFSKAVCSLIDLMGEGSQSVDEKNDMLAEIYTRVWSLTFTMRGAVSSYEIKYGKDYSEWSKIGEWYSAVDSILKSLGNGIQSAFQGNKALMMHAVAFWKEYVENRYKKHGGGVFSYTEDCIAKIREFEPSFLKTEQEEYERKKAEEEEKKRWEKERQNKPIAEVVAELEGAATIQKDFFKNCIHCKELVSITIPNSVTTIEKGAFAGCENLEEIIFSESSNTITIEKEAFAEFRFLKTVVLAGKNLKIEKSAFRWCNALEFVDFSKITDSVYIGGDAFFGCKLLGDITLNVKIVESIESGAFAFCSKLSKLIISPTTIVEYIGGQAFFKSGVKEQIINVKKLSRGFSQSTSVKWTVPLDCEIAEGGSLPTGVVRKDFSKMKQGTGEKKGFLAMIKGLFK